MNKRLAIVVAAVLLVAVVGVLAVTGVFQGKVEVETGTRVNCVYGHVISDDVEMIEVPSRSAASYRVREEETTCDLHKSLEALYAEAQKAIGSGDLETAEQKLKAIVTQESDFGRAAAQLASIRAGKKPDEDKKSPVPEKPANSTRKPGEGRVTGPVASLEKYVPKTLEGYVGRSAAVEPSSISRDYEPVSNKKVVILVIVAEQHTSVAKAQSALNSQIESAVRGSIKKATVNGHAIQLGDDGRGSAFAGYTDGSVMVVMEIAAAKDTDPGNLLDELRDVVVQLP